MNLLKEDEKYRWETLIEVDFLAGDQSVMAVRFANGATQLRFGDDFGLSIFKRELRRLLPSGVNQWRRAFGYHVDDADASKGADDGEEEDEEDDANNVDDGDGGGQDEVLEEDED